MATRGYKEEMTANGCGGMKAFWNSGVVMVAQPCEYTKSHRNEQDTELLSQ